MESNSAYNERELLLRIASGNAEAFSILFRRYRGKLYHYILDFTQSKETAEDAVHDVFLKLWSGRETLPAIENLNAYLYRMCRNLAISGLRRKATENLILAELRQESMVPVPDVDLISQKEIRAFILQAMDKLSPQQRKIFILSKQDGLKHEEIAAQLSISINTVKTHMGRALQILREEISQSYGAMAVAIFVIYGLS